MDANSIYDHAMTITEQRDADAYFEVLVQHTMETGMPRAAAEDAVRRSLGYWAGYFDNTTRERVERLFGCEHPYFGSIAQHGPPTPELAFALGLQIGQALRRRRDS
jgi:hypothetical protein